MSIRAASEDGSDPKHVTEQLDDVEMETVNASKPNPAFEAPPLVQALTADERKRMERTLVRKIDFRLLPPVIIMYIMVCCRPFKDTCILANNFQNYLDRNNIATARLSGKVGLQEDLNMTDSQYETCVSILFVGYILMQIPSNLFLNKVGKPALYLPAVMV